MARLELIVDPSRARQGFREAGQAADKYSRDAKQATNATDRVRGSFASLATMARRTLGPAIAAVGVGTLARFSQQAIESVANLDELADTAGISTVRFQELTKAFSDMGGVAEDVSGAALRRFNRRLGLAREGTGAAVDALDRLNINLSQDTGDALDAAVQKLANMEDGADRAALASRLFGEDAGPAMAAALGQGQDALDATTEKLHEQGRIMDEETADAARRLNDRYNELADTLDTTFKRAVVGAAEALLDLFNMQQELPQIQEDLDRLARRRDFLLENLDDSPFPKELRKELNKINEEMLTLQKRKQELLADVRDNGGGTGGGDVRDNGGGTGGGTGGGDGGYDTDRQKRIDNIIAGLQEQADTYGMSAEQIQLYRLQLAGAAEEEIQQAGVLAQTIGARREHEQAIKDGTQAWDEYFQQLEHNRQADRNLVTGMEEKIRLQGLSEREQAQAAATSRLSADATDEQREAVRKLAGELYDLKEQARRTDEELSEFGKQAARNTQDIISEFMLDPIDQGFDGLVDSFTQMLRQMAAEAAAANIADMLFRNEGAPLKGAFGGGGQSGDIFSLIGSSIASAFGGGGGGGFEGGGYTGSGPRSGGLDGRGGFPAILHPRERVIDETKQNSQPQEAPVIININVNGVLDSGDLRQSSGQIAAKAAQAVQRGRRNL